MTAEELVPCPAHLCGTDIGFCGLCGTAGAVTKAMADDYHRMQGRRTTVPEVPPMSDEDREELMQLARREAGALLVAGVHPTPAGLKAEADRITRDLSATPIPGREVLTRAIIALLRKVFP